MECVLCVCVCDYGRPNVLLECANSNEIREFWSHFLLSDESFVVKLRVMSFIFRKYEIDVVCIKYSVSICSMHKLHSFYAHEIILCAHFLFDFVPLAYIWIAFVMYMWYALNSSLEQKKAEFFSFKFYRIRSVCFLLRNHCMFLPSIDLVFETCLRPTAVFSLHLFLSPLQQMFFDIPEFELFIMFHVLKSIPYSLLCRLIATKKKRREKPHSNGRIALSFI